MDAEGTALSAVGVVEALVGLELWEQVEQVAALLIRFPEGVAPVLEVVAAVDQDWADAMAERFGNPPNAMVVLADVAAARGTSSARNGSPPPSRTRPGRGKRLPL
ncbi:hypothetical protein GCM10029964_103430 [Kibdelosporangium lantanae]